MTSVDTANARRVQKQLGCHHTMRSPRRKLRPSQVFTAFAPLVEDAIRNRIARELRNSDARTAKVILEQVFEAMFGPEATSALRSRFYMYAAPLMRNSLLRCLSDGSLTVRELQPLVLREWIARLQLADPRCRLVAELRYFCGFSVKEIVSIISVPGWVVVRELRYALFLLEDRATSPRSI